MNIFDMHIHTYGPEFDVDAMLAEMQKAGVFGGCIFSPPPVEFNTKRGMPFRARLDRILAITRGYDGRLFPVLWIHPDEDDIIENVKVAAAEGIAGFKIICNDFYPYEDRCMALLTAIAALDKPVFFHTGILYSAPAETHSEYSRPIHFERLEEIEGLRFSIGHCGWPWIDECLALYGRMSYHLTVPNGRRPAEMFLDLTPGAPMDRREEMLRKVYLFGQNTGNNILFGTDQIAERYKGEGTSRWLKADTAIYGKLGVRLELIRKTYEDNLMRFLGKQEYRDKHVLRIWGTTPYSTETPAIIEKWYKKLAFPKEYDAEF